MRSASRELSDAMPDEYSAADLDGMELHEPEMIIEGILPTGLSFVAGPPKFGKTYLNLMLGVSVASGEYFLGRKTKRCPVLYLYLEGDAAQVNRRLHDIYGERKYPRDLIFVHSIQPLAAGGFATLSRLITRYNPGLVIIDTWQLVRGEDMLGTGRGQTAYMREYGELTSLRQELCNKMGVSVLLTHHTAKTSAHDKAADDLNRLNGSTALSGCADAVLVLSGTRGSGRITLSAHGRSFEDTEIVLTRTKPMGWKAADAPKENWTELQNALVGILQKHPEGITVSQVRDILPNAAEDSVRRQLNRWAYLGKITKDGKRFSLPEKI